MFKLALMSGKDEVVEEEAAVGATAAIDDSSTSPLRIHPFFNKKNWLPETRGGRPTSGNDSAGGVKQERDEKSRPLPKYKRSEGNCGADNSSASSSPSSSSY